MHVRVQDLLAKAISFLPRFCSEDQIQQASHAAAEEQEVHARTHAHTHAPTHA